MEDQNNSQKLRNSLMHDGNSFCHLIEQVSEIENKALPNGY
jgi:hypothetical protein